MKSVGDVSFWLTSHAFPGKTWITKGLMMILSVKFGMLLSIGVQIPVELIKF